MELGRGGVYYRRVYAPDLLYLSSAINTVGKQTAFYLYL